MDNSPIVVVAVASFSGDTEAVFEFVSALPAACGAAFVIVQHLGVVREMLMDGDLAKRTPFPVVHAQNCAVPEANHIYVMPANTTLKIIDGRFSVTASASGLHRPGDTLFTSLANDRADNAIGVVLSGAGSDGALGIKAIASVGGATFAQYPGSARFPSMPISAIETGCVDAVLRPNEIAHQLIHLSRKVVPSAKVARHTVVEA